MRERGDELGHSGERTITPIANNGEVSQRIAQSIIKNGPPNFLDATKLDDEDWERVLPILVGRIRIIG